MFALSSVWRNTLLQNEANKGHNPGGKVKLPLLPGVTGSAAYYGKHDCYRLYLSRVWGPAPMRYVLWIGKNPSTATAMFDDPTIRREITYTASLGFTSYMKANVCDYRATDPADLVMPGIRPRSRENLQMIGKLAKRASMIIVCYGVFPGSLLPLADEMVSMLRTRGHELWCLGRTKDGHPKHPLYLSKNTKLVRF